jgi:hypothetical protein
MPLKLRYDAKAGKLVEVPGVWVDDSADGISAEANKQFREQYSYEAELQVLRLAVIKLAADQLPSEYLAALSDLDNYTAAKTAEAEYQALLVDRSKWAAAGAEKTKAALASAGLAVTVPIKTVADLEKFAMEKITNLDDMKANIEKSLQ